MLKPVNRHILVEYEPPETKKNMDILLPDDYKPPQEDYTLVKVLSVSQDVSFGCHPGEQILIDKKMLEEIRINHSTYYLILENYVIGVMSE
jgi:co-chaperonin GroES (HSP10)